MDLASVLIEGIVVLVVVVLVAVVEVIAVRMNPLDVLGFVVLVSDV